MKKWYFWNSCSSKKAASLKKYLLWKSNTCVDAGILKKWSFIESAYFEEVAVLEKSLHMPEGKPPFEKIIPKLNFCWRLIGQSSKCGFSECYNVGIWHMIQARFLLSYSALWYILLHYNCKMRIYLFDFNFSIYFLFSLISFFLCQSIRSCSCDVLVFTFAII